MMNMAYSFLDGIIHNNLCLARFVLAYKLEPEIQNKYFTYTNLATSAFVAPLSQYSILHITSAKGKLTHKQQKNMDNPRLDDHSHSCIQKFRNVHTVPDLII
jgi:hypothetical protein